MSSAERAGATIDSDRTWSNLVYVEADVEVREGARLTVAAGTHVVMAAGTSLKVEDGALIASGTRARPIRFCGAEEGVGFWNSVVVEADAAESSELRNVTLADAGGEDAALVLRAGVRVEELLIDGSASDGVWADDFGVESAGLSVRGAEGAALVLTSSAAATHFPRGGTFRDNGEDAVRLRFSEMRTETTFPDVGMPYVQEADVAAPEGTLTFEAGVDYRFAPGVGMSLGAAVGRQIEVLVNGTESKPVIFRGVEQTPGSWKGIEVIDNVRTSSAFSHVEIRDGGRDFYVLYFRSAVALDHVLLDGNNGGMFVAGQGLAPGSSDLTIRNTAGSPLTVRPDALVTLPEGGDLRGNELDQVSLEGGDFTGSGVVPNLGIPFYVLGVVRTLGDSSMTLSPGTRFILGGDSSFEFGGDGGDATIVAAGTQDAPIRFTGFMERAGYWPGLTTGLGVGADSKFDWIEVGHAKAGCLNLMAPVPVTHSSFFDCQGYGIRKNIDDTSDYASTNSFRNTGMGNIGNLPL